MTIKINYQITDFVPKENIFTINYFSSNPELGVEKNIPLPYNDDYTAFLSGQELTNHIMGYAPSEEVEEKVASVNCDPSEILAMSTKRVLSFEEQKQNAQEFLKEAFGIYAKQSHIMSSLGFEVDANDIAYRNIGGMIKNMEAEGIETMSFCDWNNEFHELTVEQLKTIELEIIRRTQELYALKWVIRDGIEACETPEELAEYKFGIFEEFRGTGILI